MTIDLSRWDLVDEFTAREAACLILGFDAHDPNAPTWAIEPILKRMRESYSRTAIGVVLDLQHDKDNPEGVKVSNFMELLGHKLQFFYLSTERQSSDLRPSEDVMARLSAGFDQDTFRRPEISRWLSLFQIKSKYQFEKSAEADANVESAHTVLSDDGSVLPPDATRREKNVNQKRVAEAILVISHELGYGHPRDMKPHRGKTPGPKQAILKAVRADPRYKQLPLELNKDGESATFNAAWTMARRPLQDTVDGQA